MTPRGKTAESPAREPDLAASAQTSPARRAELLSVVIPLFNEEAIVPELCRRLWETLESLGPPFEVVIVDDGSSDGTVAALTQFAADHRELKVVRLSRNFGLQAAVTAGVDHTQGNVVAVMDGDLQDDPEFLGQLYGAWQQGADVAHAVKRSRTERGLRRLAFTGFHRLAGGLVRAPLNAGNFSLCDRRVIAALEKLPERNRYFPGLRTWVGFKQVEVPFDRKDRAAGEPRMGWLRLFRLAADAIFGFSYLPLKVATGIGLVATLLGVVMVGWVLFEKFVSHHAILGWPSLMVAVCLIGGAQLVTIGILGEYIGRIYDEVRQRPNYLVDEVLTFDRRKPAAPKRTTKA
jgi:polyisoprenyl-phosphate glycosyltransferase